MKDVYNKIADIIYGKDKKIAYEDAYEIAIEILKLPEMKAIPLGAVVSDDLGGRNCSTCKYWDAYTTGIDEYPQCTGIAYCKKGHWENGKPDDDYTKCFIDCVDWEENDSPNSR